MKASNNCRVILITGGSSGFGAVCVNYLASRGHRVYGTSRRAEFPSNEDSLRAPLIIPMNVCEAASVEAAVAFILQREGRLDVLVNNAGIGHAGSIEDTSIEEGKAQLETNFFGVHRVCRSVLPVMRKQGSGLIVNISSIGGLITIPFQGFYCASKSALVALTESLRMEVKPFGVQVTLIEPGDFKTGFTANRACPLKCCFQCLIILNRFVPTISTREYILICMYTSAAKMLFEAMSVVKMVSIRGPSDKFI